MRLRHFIRNSATNAAFAFAFGAALPAFAHDGYYPGDTGPSWQNSRHDPYVAAPQSPDAWLEDCRQRVSRRDRGVGGAVIGGLVGGVAGNRIAGRGDRTVGTVAGAAVGAAAGYAIDKAEDNGRNRDECEAYLDDYYAHYSAGPGGYAAGYAQGGYPYQGYGYNQGYSRYGYGAPMMMVPVQQGYSEPECTETVEYEYIDEPVRAAPRPRPAPQKRVKVVPDKRIPIK